VSRGLVADQRPAQICKESRVNILPDRDEFPKHRTDSANAQQWNSSHCPFAEWGFRDGKLQPNHQGASGFWGKPDKIKKGQGLKNLNSKKGLGHLLIPWVFVMHRMGILVLPILQTELMHISN
jgi:hypothetical protein